MEHIRLLFLKLVDIGVRMESKKKSVFADKNRNKGHKRNLQSDKIKTFFTRSLQKKQTPWPFISVIQNKIKARPI